MSNKQYDIALSFAGEDRACAQQLADALRRRNVTVFYDTDEQAMLWGVDLYAYLSDLYQNRAQYCVMFLSKYYAVKVWTNHERRAAQARAFRESREYILPIRLDDTPMDGILPTVGFLTWSAESVEGVADACVQKLRGLQVTSESEPVNWRRTAEEPPTNWREKCVKFTMLENSLEHIPKDKVLRRGTPGIVALGSIILLNGIAPFIKSSFPDISFLYHPMVSAILVVAAIGSVLLTYKYYTLLWVRMSSIKSPLGRYLGFSKFGRRTTEGDYLRYFMTAPCIYPHCDGVAYIMDAPPRAKDRHRFIGGCTVDREGHTYKVDANGIGIAHPFDFRPLDPNK
jgi:hypothetical protein